MLRLTQKSEEALMQISDRGRFEKQIEAASQEIGCRQWIDVGHQDL